MGICWVQTYCLGLCGFYFHSVMSRVSVFSIGMCDSETEVKFIGLTEITIFVSSRDFLLCTYNTNFSEHVS